MLKRFAPLVPIALSVLLAACASKPLDQTPEQIAEAQAQVRAAEVAAKRLDQHRAEQLQAQVAAEQALIDDILKRGRALIGTRYRVGGTTVSGFDCSGFVGYLFREEAGLELPRSTRDLIKIKAPIVARHDLLPGDLIFFNNRGRGQVSHAGIYMGNNRFIHSSSSRSGGVRIDSIESGYWHHSYMHAKRVLEMAPSNLASR